MAQGFDTEWLLSHYAKGAPAKTVSAPSKNDIAESDLHDYIMQECRQRCWLAVHSRMDRATTTALGVPDFIIFADGGRVFLIEAKTRTGKMKPEQLAFQAHARKLGFTVHVIRSKEEFLLTLSERNILTP